MIRCLHTLHHGVLLDNVEMACDEFDTHAKMVTEKWLLSLVIRACCRC